jgi:signal transduction histidine kinase
MKIDKNEFRMKNSKSNEPEEFINKVIFQFEPNVRNKNIHAYIIRKNENFQIMKTDWEKYQLIIFNIIQNAVKYNQQDGNIIITLNCLPMSN